jgi:hypothetical protein
MLNQAGVGLMRKGGQAQAEGMAASVKLGTDLVSSLFLVIYTDG